MMCKVDIVPVLSDILPVLDFIADTINEEIWMMSLKEQTGGRFKFRTGVMQRSDGDRS